VKSGSTSNPAEPEPDLPTQPPGNVDTASHENAVRQAKLPHRRWLVAVWSALGVWTLLVSVGTSLYAPSPGGAPEQRVIDWRRGLMVFVFVGGFLSLWVWLAVRKRASGGFGNRLSVASHGQESVQASQHENAEQSEENQQPQ